MGFHIILYVVTLVNHSGETVEAICGWFHTVWSPPKRPYRPNMICLESKTAIKLILYIYAFFDVRDNEYKPHRLVLECCRYSRWKSQVMKPTVLGDETSYWAEFAQDEANWARMKRTPYWRRVSKHSDSWWLAAYFHMIFEYRIWIGHAYVAVDLPIYMHFIVCKIGTQTYKRMCLSKTRL